MERILEGATALILGFVATLFVMNVLAAFERDGFGDVVTAYGFSDLRPPRKPPTLKTPTMVPEKRVLH